MLLPFMSSTCVIICMIWVTYQHILNYCNEPESIPGRVPPAFIDYQYPPDVAPGDGAFYSEI